MTLLAELEEFVGDHRPHATLTCDATKPDWNGYLLTVSCPCGVVLERWVTPEDAELDLLRAAAVTRDAAGGVGGVEERARSATDEHGGPE